MLLAEAVEAAEKAIGTPEAAVYVTADEGEWEATNANGDEEFERESDPLAALRALAAAAATIEEDEG